MDAIIWCINFEYSLQLTALINTIKITTLCVNRMLSTEVQEENCIQALLLCSFYTIVDVCRHKGDTKFYQIFQEYWPAHPDDPQGIRVASVIEFSVCLFSVLCSLFSSIFLILLQCKATAVCAVISIRYDT